jgi:uncharacterized protein YecE (DUF72 family)
MRRIGDIRVGISGWRYRGWRGVFYPHKLPQSRELAHAAALMQAVEINGTFYSLQRPAWFARWAAETPADFVFALKGSRFITHAKKLLEVETALANFFAQGLLGLGAKLGPFLWQFSPAFRFDPDRLERFFALLPRDTFAAAELARRHDARVDGRALVEVDANRPLRHAVEIRHGSFVDPDFIALLRRHGIALVVADTVSWPLLGDVTADFVYCRLHGSEELYASGYGDEALEVWAERVVTWARGGEVADLTHAAATPGSRRTRDVFVFFDNDAKVRAPFDALSLMRKVRERLDRGSGHDAEARGK